MTLTEFFRAIGAPAVNAGADEAQILAAEARLRGRFPEALRAWYREADGFEGEAAHCLWQFRSLQRLYTLTEVFPAVHEISVSREEPCDSQAIASDYVIICDAFINLPFYAVNIRADSPYYSEVISASEETPTEAYSVAPSFERFAEHLFQSPNDAFLCVLNQTF